MPYDTQMALAVCRYDYEGVIDEDLDFSESAHIDYDMDRQPSVQSVKAFTAQQNYRRREKERRAARDVEESRRHSEAVRRYRETHDAEEYQQARTRKADVLQLSDRLIRAWDATMAGRTVKTVKYDRIGIIIPCQITKIQRVTMLLYALDTQWQRVNRLCRGTVQ